MQLSWAGLGQQDQEMCQSKQEVIMNQSRYNLLNFAAHSSISLAERLELYRFYEE